MYDTVSTLYFEGGWVAVLSTKLVKLREVNTYGSPEGRGRRKLKEQVRASFPNARAIPPAEDDVYASGCKGHRS